MRTLEDELQEANAAFYEAFRERDVDGMVRLWAQNAPVVCMHPGMTALVGRDAVIRSWRGILMHPSAPQIECSGAEVHILGTSALVTCLEGTPGEAPRLIATNVFTREEGRWRMVCHQSAPLSLASLPEKGTPVDVPDPSTLN